MAKFIFADKIVYAVPSQEYDSCYPFVLCVFDFDFAI